ncbi:MAG: hypothetical protein AB1938_17625 [Myxococcota bacterium]
MRTRLAIALLGAGLGACGGTTAPQPVELFTRVDAAPTPYVDPGTERFSVAPVEAVGATRAGTLVVAGDGRVQEVVAGALTRRTLYANGSLDALGAVAQVSPRVEGGAWLAAANGLFVLEGEYVSASPLSEGRGGVFSVVERSAGALEGLWFASDSGLVRRKGSALDALLVPGLVTVKQVAISGDGARGFAAGEGGLRLLSVVEGRLMAQEPVLTLTDVSHVAAGRTVLGALAREGLVIVDPGRTPAWRLFPLTGHTLLALAGDGTADVLWLRTADGVLAVEGDTVKRLEVAAAASVSLALTPGGDVLVSSEDGVRRLRTGVGTTDVSFARDLAPWLSTTCGACHSTYTNLPDFAPRAEDALRRVKNGDMPRCDGSTRCAQPLSPSDYAVLDGWIRGGKQP